MLISPQKNLYVCYIVCVQLNNLMYCKLIIKQYFCIVTVLMQEKKIREKGLNTGKWILEK